MVVLTWHASQTAAEVGVLGTDTRWPEVQSPLGTGGHVSLRCCAAVCMVPGGQGRQAHFRSGPQAGGSAAPAGAGAASRSLRVQQATSTRAAAAAASSVLPVRRAAPPTSQDGAVAHAPPVCGFAVALPARAAAHPRARRTAACLHAARCARVRSAAAARWRRRWLAGPTYCPTVQENGTVVLWSTRSRQHRAQTRGAGITSRVAPRARHTPFDPCGPRPKAAPARRVAARAQGQGAEHVAAAARRGSMPGRQVATAGDAVWRGGQNQMGHKRSSHGRGDCGGPGVGGGSGGGG